MKKRRKKQKSIEKVILCLFDEEAFNNFENALEKHSKPVKK